ncbi:thiamine pyrophosphate-binding protein [Pseudonocardia sp. ICBG162]|uniref:thiamine pyrophosphate-binding protein n=1 Tax=Pseudonocardia sp. ICBG162 TaxID=2846761 RepID=UPI001CF71068|nr:thiamine pyrophosphate-binding protein [Pseudonocardia sp. ICBG162]
MTTVRDAALAVLRRQGATTLFANPGSTEISLLTDLPGDLEFVLTLHEGSVVGMATGWALARHRPAVAILHTTAGLGNAVGALATARVNRAPMVVVVGQQDRRHLAFEPFLTGRRLDELVRPHAVWVDEPGRAQDVPGALARAWHEADLHRGPAVVIVPMDDWDAEHDGAAGAAPVRSLRPAAADPAACDAIAELIAGSRSPALVAGAGADDERTWAALTALADRLAMPAWQEPFGARAGFPRDHPRFAGHLPAGRAGVRSSLEGHDLVLVVGAAAFRQYPYEDGPLVEGDTRVVVITDDPDEALRSPADLAVVASPAAVCAELARRVPARDAAPSAVHRARVVEPPAAGAPLRPEHVFAALAERLPQQAVVVEETPSSRALLHELVPARAPLGFLSAAMGGLGFGLPAAVGVRMGSPQRPVVALVGDGSSLYGIQSLWSAAHYDVGVLVIVLSNGRYAIMDRLAGGRGSATGTPGTAPWPAFEEISISGLGTSLGCESHRVVDHAGLLEVLDEIVPTLERRTTPLVLDVAVAP